MVHGTNQRRRRHRGTCVRRQPEKIAAAGKDFLFSLLTALPAHRGVTTSFFQ